MMDSVQKATLAALRNFFLAGSGEELTSACIALANTKGKPTDMGDMDWEEAEFAFNKLFVGPMALQAPPYASYYLEAEPQLMGENTLKVRRLYDMAGLISPLQGHLPDDHLGVELDAALGLLSTTERLDAQEPRALWRYFLHDHLQTWLPQFLNQARSAETGHPAVDLALDHLEAWLNDQETKQEGLDQ
jgi:putative dimethyl sulfoxide reductase chaperone